MSAKAILEWGGGSGLNGNVSQKNWEKGELVMISINIKKIILPQNLKKKSNKLKILPIPHSAICSIFLRAKRINMGSGPEYLYITPLCVFIF